MDLPVLAIIMSLYNHQTGTAVWIRLYGRRYAPRQEDIIHTMPQG